MGASISDKPVVSTFRIKEDRGSRFIQNVMLVLT
jgi:hypothetical protein